MPGSWLVSGSWWPGGVRGHSVRGWGELSRPSNYEHKPGRGGDTHCHVFLFAKEAHCYVIPEWRAFCNTTRCNFVFGEGNIKVPVGLHHAACCQDGLKTWEVHNLVILKRLSEWSSLPESRHSVGPSTLVGLKRIFQGPIHLLEQTLKKNTLTPHTVALCCNKETSLTLPSSFCFLLVAREATTLEYQGPLSKNHL